VGDELVESVEGDERRDFEYTHEDGAAILRWKRYCSWFCIASSSERQTLLNSRKGSWRLVARDWIPLELGWAPN